MLTPLRSTCQHGRGDQRGLITKGITRDLFYLAQCLPGGITRKERVKGRVAKENIIWKDEMKSSYDELFNIKAYSRVCRITCTCVTSVIEKELIPENLPIFRFKIEE